jgi:hypothetical protein
MILIKKFNLKAILSIITLVFLSSVNLLAFSAEITSIEGEIKYLKGTSNDWQVASVGASLEKGDKIGSSENSWAEISFSVGHKAKLGPNSFMVINEMSNKTSLELFKGNLLSKVKKLSKNENYEVKTGEGVASVRGTEFEVSFGPSRGMVVAVLEGSVLAAELSTGQEIMVPAGKFTSVIKGQAPAEPDDIANMPQSSSTGGTGDQAAADGEGEEEAEEDAETEEEGTEESAEEKTEEDTREMASVKQELRQEMREAVSDIKVDVADARDVIETTKDTDQSTGRTLRDFHGNLVRVEQYLQRPNRNTMHFINITKRSNYKYKGRMNVAESGARLDTLETKINFNMNLPEKMSDWMGFFKDVDDRDLDFHPLNMEVKMSNQVDSMLMTAQWNEVEDDMDEPTIKITSGKEGTWNLVTADFEDYTEEDPRYYIYNQNTEKESIGMASEERAEAWIISPKLLLYKDLNGNGEWDISEATNDNIMWVRSGNESWGINNDGNILSFNDFEEGNINPFDVVKNIAMEGSWVIRYSDEIIEDPNYILNWNESDYDKDWGNNMGWDDVVANQNAALAGFNRANDFLSNNLDLVVTPDFIVPILEDIVKGSVSSM